MLICTVVHNIGRKSHGSTLGASSPPPQVFVLRPLCLLYRISNSMRSSCSKKCEIISPTSAPVIFKQVGQRRSTWATHVSSTWDPMPFSFLVAWTMENGFCYTVWYSTFQSYWGSTVEMGFHIKFLFYVRPIHVWRSRTPDGVWCAHFYGVITTIMDQKLQLLKPLNKRELYTM
jgi:hypothetical protein